MLLLSFYFAASASAGNCKGRIINPITDVCWSCVFPIKLGGVTLSSGKNADPETDANRLCLCASGANITVGLNMSFWEPLRTAEVVRTPYCFPSLGGMELNVGIRAPAHGRTPNKSTSAQRSSFYHLRPSNRSQKLDRRRRPRASHQTWEPTVMLSTLPRALISSALLMLLSSSAVAYDKQSAMDAAKEEAARLSIKDILTESSASGTVPEYGSDVSELKDLFAKGQGNLLTPGSSKADGCLSQTSMDCRAVQVIYDTHSRPDWEESDFDNILADRDHLLNKLPDLPPNGQEICETITTTRPPQTDFSVCEETTVGSSTQSCFEGWTEKLDVSTLFECIARTGKKLTVECLADYNETSQDYTCLHTPPQTCHVGEKVQIHSTYQYRCKTQQFEQNTYRCNRYLEVVGYSGCEIGKFFEAQSETSASLGKDACNGGDVIELKYQCANDFIPRLRIETNVKNSANFGFEIQAADFQNEHYFSNCKGVWTGQTRCIGVNCTVDIKMDIYTRPGKWDYSGSIQKRFSFQKNVNDISLDKWRTTCVSDDGKVVEFES